MSASKKHQKNHGIQRTPLKLKDLNVSSDDPPKGCFSFLLSHHSCTSKNGNNNNNKTPNTSPNFRVLKENLEKKSSHLPDLSDCRTKNVKKNPNLMKINGGFGSSFDLSDGVNKFTSGFHFKLNDDDDDDDDDTSGVVEVRKPNSSYDLSDEISRNETGFELCLSDNAENVRKPASKNDLSGDYAEDFTPVDKLGCRCDSFSFGRSNKADKLEGNNPNCSDLCRNPRPPAAVQVSVSGLPEMYAGSPDTCYAAGDPVTRVSEHGKSRPKGILSNGNNNLFGSCVNKGFQDEGENVVGEFSNRDPKREVIVLDDALDDINELRFDGCEKSELFNYGGVSSSSSSSHSFVSGLFDKSSVTSFAASNSRNKTFGQHSYSSSKSRYDHENQNSHRLEEYLGIGNVIQTPQSVSSPCKISHSYFSLSDLSRDQISRLWFECELDSVTELLRDCQKSELDSRRARFEFNPLIKLDNSSVDLTLFRESLDTVMSDISESPVHRLPVSEARILWREGLASRLLEMDELDFSGYLDDDDIAPAVSNKIIEGSYNTTMSLQLEDGFSRKRNVSPLLEGSKSCHTSVDADGRYELVPKDSTNWTCYKNNLFQV